jgi:hypothetical protein
MRIRYFSDRFGHAVRFVSISAALGLGPLATTIQAQDGPRYLSQVGIATGTVAPQGLAFASLSGTTRSPAGNVDGSLALGIGFGSAEESLGVQVTAQITSLTDAFADSGYLSLKLSRRLGERPLYLAIQGDHLVNWGDSALVDPSAKIALTYFTTVQSGNGTFPVMMTLGAGTKVRNSNTDPGVFAGVGVGLSRNVGASIAWTGDYVDLGLGFKVSDQISMTASVEDVFDQKSRRRASFSVNYTFRNLFGG